MKEYQKKNRRYFVGALITILISTIFAVALQFFKGDVLDYAVAGEIKETICYVCLLIAFIICEVLSYFCYKQFSAKFVVRCTGELKHDIFESILGRSYVAYKERSQGEYIAKYTNEADTIKERRFSMLPMFWEILFKIIFVSVALFILDWRVAIITIVLLTTPLYIPKIIEKRLQNAQYAHIQAVEDNLTKVNDWLSGFEIIKNYSIEQKILSRFKVVNNNAMDKCLKETQLGAVSQLITTLISYLSYFIVLACSAWLVWKGDFSAGDFFVAIGMIDQLSYPLISLAGITRQLIAIKPVCDGMKDFLAESTLSGCESELSGFQSDIQFSDVSFGYDEKLPILVDGDAITDFSSTYGCITVVRQEAILFHDTLRNNLTMYQDIADDRLLHILTEVGLEKFATTNCLDYMIEESGANFSGGEKKRICLARALLRNTDVLILDEPLANLDIVTVERIEDLILSIEGRTLLVVSHQFSPEKLSAFSEVIDFFIH